MDSETTQSTPPKSEDADIDQEDAKSADEKLAMQITDLVSISTPAQVGVSYTTVTFTSCMDERG